MRFGKHPAKADYRTLRLKTYTEAALPAPPPSADTLATVSATLRISDPTVLFPMDGNDQYGDCTIAAMAHAVTLYRGLAGTLKIPGGPRVVRTYFHLTGGVDSGLNELDVLNYWRQHRAFGDEILAYAKVDPKNHELVQQAVAIFGGLYIGFQVQQDCVYEFDRGQPWTPGPLTRDGHAVFVVGYDAAGVTVLTWGNTQRATWAWWDECVDEAYAVIPPEVQRTPINGFDLAQLEADLQALMD